MNPLLSVVIYAPTVGHSFSRCVDSILAQDAAEMIEVLVVVREDQAWETSDPRVQVIRQPAGSGPGILRNAGIDQSRGKFIAFLPVFLTASPGWATALLEEHARCPAPVLIGRIDDAPGGNAISRAAFICERSISLPTAIGPLPNAPAINASYRREIFDDGSRFPDLPTEADIAFHRQLARRLPQPLHGAPSVLAYHHGPKRWREFLRYQWGEGRRFARWRRESGHAGLVERTMILLTWWLIPLRMLQRTLSAPGADAASRAFVLRNLPLVWLGWSARGLGEATGLL